MKDIEAVRKFNADAVARSIATDRGTLTRDAACMASLAATIANVAGKGRDVSDDLTALTQRVTALLALAVKIGAATEAHEVLAVDLS